MTSILKADNIQDADGNNIINESSNTITIGASGDTISIPSGATIANSGTATGFGGSNSKTFYAYLSSSQSATNAANTELVFNTEVHDADSVYNNSNGRYTPGVGTYLVSAGLSIDDQSGSGDDFYMKFLVNGDTSLPYSQQRSGGGHSNFSNQSGSAVITLSSASDYISVFGYHDAGSGRNFQSNLCFFTGFKLI